MPEHPEIRSLEAERAVIGAILLDRNALPAVLDVVTPGDFDAEAHRRILAAVIALQDRGQPPDLILLADELRNRGHIEGVGGPAYLAELMDSSPSAANVAHYARIVHEKAATRKLVEAARRIIARAHDLNGDGLDALIAFSQKEILAASSAGAGSTGMDIRTLIKKTFRDIEERHQHGDALPGLSTGLVSLDTLTGGLKRGCSYSFAGRPGTGKSALLGGIARTVAGTGGPVLINSLEMPKDEVSLRFLSAEAKIDGYRLSRGYLKETEWPRIAHATDALAKLPITIDDTAGLPIDRLMARARRIKAESGLALVTVDYLQLVRPSQRWATREAEVAEVSRSLKVLAKELDVPVVSAAQLNRAVESRKDKRPTLADLRESGAIEQDADVIVFLSANESEETVNLTIAKNRQGPTGKVSLMFNKKLTQFSDVKREA
ncbi:MAG TPA: replicative DNA helicase [Syntrophales bacterium]|nr:replicative DNA helicase [Syntrophales bacterium]